MVSKFKKALITLAIFVLGFYALLAVQLMGAGPGEMPRDHPDIRQVESLLGGARIEILNSYMVTGNWSGDIDRGFVGRISSTDSVESNTPPLLEAALPGDELPAPLRSAVRFLATHIGGDQADWFPGADEILTARYRVQALAVESQDAGVDSSRLLIIRPDDGMIYYGWVKF